MSTEVTRRGFLAKVGATALGLGSVTALLKPKVTDAYNSTWHALPQWQRNQAIVNATYRDLGKYLGDPAGQCKVWVQNVVARASNYHVWLPQNAPDAYGWYWRQDQHVVGVLMCRVFRVGEIIQMHWKNAGNGVINPHTAIVIGTSPYGMEWVDSNMVAKFTVGTHSVSYSAFYAQAVSYSVYYIL